MKTTPVNQVPARAGEVNPATPLKTGVVRRTDQTMPEVAVLMVPGVQREAAPMVVQEVVVSNSPEGSKNLID